MNVSRAPFLIVETGQPVDSLKRYGRFPHWIRVAAGLSAHEVVEVNAERGDPLPPAADLAGVIVSGSAAFVTDRAEWSERSADWLREAAHAGMPLLALFPGSPRVVRVDVEQVVPNCAQHVPRLVPQPVPQAAPAN